MDFLSLIAVVLNVTNGAVIATYPAETETPKWVIDGGYAVVQIEDDGSTDEARNAPGYDGGWSKVPDAEKVTLLAPAKADADAEAVKKTEADAAINALLSGALTPDQEKELAVELLKKVLQDPDLLKDFVAKEKE